MDNQYDKHPMAGKSESLPPVRSSEVVPPNEHEVILDAQRKIVDVWLDASLNEAGKILHAYKIGFEAGQLVRGNSRI